MGPARGMADWPNMVRDQYRVTLVSDNLPAARVVNVSQAAFRRTFHRIESSSCLPPFHTVLYWFLHGRRARTEG
jgi:hypothetical protein